MPTINWIGKKAVVNHHRKVPYRLLHGEHSFSVGDPNSGNLLVQGDNLEALKALLPYYGGQIKCVYIDPPYNTGNEGWIYNDSVSSQEIKKWLGNVVGKEGDDLSRHDKWMCMMYPRLRMLREFLREDGVIFVSADDFEHRHLSLLMDEIFGSRNRIETMIWKKSYGGGAKPFLNPDIIRGIAKDFKTETDDKAFLWVDTNLVPISSRSDKKITAALKSLAELDNRTAIHACIHGAGEESFKRNTLTAVKFKNIENSINNLLQYKLNLYLRINPIGLDPIEVETIFSKLMQIRGDLPLKTYLGPIELLYDHAIDRMMVFQGNDAFFSHSARKLKNRSAKMPDFKPTNASIYTWNKLLEKNYNVGYAKVPRHIELKCFENSKPKESEKKENEIEWINTLLLFKGWEKEIYALKMLEILSRPKGSRIEIEFENKWIDPTFLSHAFSCPKFYELKKVKVLFLAAYKSGRTPKLVPLRWGTVCYLNTTDCRNENHSLNITVEIGEYAYDLRPRIPKDSKMPFFDYLTEYMGGGRIPFASDTSYFCQYVGLQLRKEPIDSLTTPKEAAFKSIILDLTRGNYEKAKQDIYYRIKLIKSTNNTSKTENVPFKGGILSVKEGQTIELTFEACNPNLGNPGYPGVSEAKIILTSTESDNVKIAPGSIRFSKYGEQAVRIKFRRAGEYKGDLIFETVASDARISSFRLPFNVTLRR